MQYLVLFWIERTHTNAITQKMKFNQYPMDFN